MESTRLKIKIKKMINHSQSTEQQIIIEYFGDRVGNFLDCGSNDGITINNTYALAVYKKWSGICVEPAPKAFNKLQMLYAERKDIVCVNVAISNYTGRAILWDSGSHITVEDSSLLSSLDSNEIKRWGNTTEFTELEVNVITFNQLMELHLFKSFQLISIDCENCDYLICQQIDLNKWGVEMLIVEFNGNDKERFDELILPQGYKLFHKNSENLIYTK